MLGLFHFSQTEASEGKKSWQKESEKKERIKSDKNDLLN